MRQQSPTKKPAEDVEEIKKSLELISHEITKVVCQQRGLLDLQDDVRQLKTLIQVKDLMIEQLDRRIDDLEQHSWKDELLISGLEIPREMTVCQLLPQIQICLHWNIRNLSASTAESFQKTGAGAEN